MTGGGTILLADDPNSRLYGAVASNVLDNINNTIVGAGQFGAGQLTFINGAAGIVNANSANNALIINTGTTLTNSGLIEATGAAGIVLTNTTYDGSSGGTLLAAGGNIDVTGASVIGGLLSSTGTSEFFVGFSQIATLNGSAHTITNAGTFAVTNNGTLLTYGTIANKGTIAMQADNYSTDLIVESPTLTLTGLGTISLADSSNNRIYGAVAADVLNNVNNTIIGAGQLGAGQLTVVNSGTIEAVGSNALQVNLGSTLTNNTNGKLIGMGAGGLSLQNGTYSNSGLIEAQDASNVTFRSDAVLTNSANGTLTGGTYEAMSRGNGATVSITGAAITTDAASIILSGANSNILFGGTGIESSLTTIAKGGSLQALAGRGYTTTLKLVNSGTINLAGGTFKAPTLSDRVGSTLSGFGNVASRVTSAGAIVATGGTLDLKGATNTISGATSGTGTLSFDKGTTTFNAGATLGGSSIAVINAANLVLNTGLSFAGTFDIVGATTLSGLGTFTNTGLFEETGTGTGAISDPFSNAGTISTASGGTLAFSGGLANTGLILDNGGFTDTAALTGGSLTVGAAGSAATIATAAGSGASTIATLTVRGGTLNTSGTLVKVTGDYNNTAAGVGNSYNPFAGVTGTINGQGTQLAVVGVNGTTITTMNGVMTIGVARNGTASFVIENTGASGSGGPARRAPDHGEWRQHQRHEPLRQRRHRAGFRAHRGGQQQRDVHDRLHDRLAWGRFHPYRDRLRQCGRPDPEHPHRGSAHVGPGCDRDGGLAARHIRRRPDRAGARVGPVAHTLLPPRLPGEGAGWDRHPPCLVLLQPCPSPGANGRVPPPQVVCAATRCNMARCSPRLRAVHESAHPLSLPAGVW